MVSEDIVGTSPGEKIIFSAGGIRVPDNPVIPFIEGDGIGRDIWKATQQVLDAGIQKAYKRDRSIIWFEVFAGEKAKAQFGEWLPDNTVKAIS